MVVNLVTGRAWMAQVQREALVLHLIWSFGIISDPF